MTDHKVNPHSEAEIQFLPRLKSPFFFDCAACGRCCGSFTIILSPYDIFRLRKGTSLKTRQLFDEGIIAVREESFKEVFGFAPVADFLTAFGLTQSDPVPVAFLQQFKKNNAGREECCFLEKPVDGKRFCRIYQNRPTMCRLHPLGCVTLGGRRRWFFRKPECKEKNWREQTVEEWISLSDARPFLSANVQFLRLMKEFLNPACSFASLSEEQKQMVERILYNFDAFPEKGKKQTWRNINKRFLQWRPELQNT